MNNKKRILAGALTLSILTSLTMPAVRVNAESWNDGEMKNYLVVLRDDAYSPATYSTAQYTATGSAETASSRNYMVLSMTQEEALELYQDERVVSVEEDIIVTAMAKKEKGNKGGEKEKKDRKDDKNKQDDDDVIIRLEDLVKPEEKESYEWNLTAIHATPEDLAAYPTDESQVRVAVLDSGMSVCEDLDVAEYLNLVAEEQEIITFDEDGTGHGTAVAGVLAANDDNEGIVGVAPDVTLYSVKVFDYSNEAPISRIIEGIYWAIDNDIHILNMSFGTTVNSYALHQAIQAADEAGILMVAAAGNSGVVEYPAAYPEVIAVGATDYQGNRADFSATGAALELMAPGECVLSDSFYGGIMAVSGTSVAAPHVAGAAALLWAKDMTKSSDFIRQLLSASANRSLSTSTEEYGNGLLDVQHAFEIYEEFEAEYVPGVFEYAGIVENTEEYVVGEEPGYVVGSWNNEAGGHGASIVNNASSFYSANDLMVLRKVSVLVDGSAKYSSAYDRKIKDENQGCVNFHGGRCYGSRALRTMDNYVNDLIFIFEVAVALRCTESASDKTSQQQLIDDVASAVQKKTGVVIKADLVLAMKELIEETGLASVTGDQNTREMKSLKALGAALHLAGDVYAHRSIVPRDSIEDGKFSTAYFDMDGTACTLAEVCEKAYNTRNDNKADRCEDNQWECFKLCVETGAVEFRDITFWMSDTVKNSRKIYEDNPSFYKTRFSVGTNYTVGYLMDLYAASVVDSKGNLEKYEPEKMYIDYLVFLPGEAGNSYAIRLNNLKGLYTAIGFKWESTWAAYTTTVAR